jgi:hypothetical protein
MLEEVGREIRPQIAANLIFCYQEEKAMEAYDTLHASPTRFSFLRDVSNSPMRLPAIFSIQQTAASVHFKWFRPMKIESSGYMHHHHHER